MGNVIHTLLGIFLSAVKAFFSAVVEIAWGIATFFLLGGLMAYFKQDPTMIALLFKLVLFIQQNWLWFFWALLIWEFATNLKDWLKPIEVQTLKATKSKENKL